MVVLIPVSLSLIYIFSSLHTREIQIYWLEANGVTQRHCQSQFSIYVKEGLMHMTCMEV